MKKEIKGEKTMGLTYDGITYRSLEEQVRYDAEQVQALKQADVTINENLQTINTEINGKLTAPTNPSAESAVTMLADGTVGTKPLSEIGAGKLYRYDIKLKYVSNSSGTWLYDTYIYDTEEIETFTIDMLKLKLPKVTNAVLESDVGWGFFGNIYYPSSTSNKIQFKGDAIDNEVTPVGQEYYLEIDVDASTIERVTKTEL